MLILVTGGAGSGKSLLAERISMQLKRMPFWYVATMQVWDQECRDRIGRHRRQRAGKGFQTVEAPCASGGSGSSTAAGRNSTAGMFEQSGGK